MGMNEGVDGGTVGMGGEPERGSLVVRLHPLCSELFHHLPG